MPRDRTTSAALVTAKPPLPDAPLIPSRALVASAVRYPGTMPGIFHSAQPWQHEGYRHYNICGEARFAARYMGRAMSRATLRIAKTTAGETKVLKDGLASQLLDALFAGKDGQAQMLEAFGVHLTIAGECYLVGRSSTRDPDDPSKEFLDGQEHDIWEVVSILEMRKDARGWAIHHEGYAPILLTDQDVVIRVWVPDPADRTKADSPFRSLLPILREIEWLTMHIFAQVSSRLAGAGLMFVSNDIDFPPPPPVDGKAAEYSNQATGLMMVLANAMETTLKNPGNAAARVPIVVTVDPEVLKSDPAKILQFWSQLDDKARDMRNDSVRRFALGMDLQPEMILGMSSNGGTGGGNSNGVSHWGAWQIEEQTIKLSVEPMLEVVTNTLVVAYLAPLMERAYDGEQIIADTTRLRLRPDRSQEALELNARGLLSDAKTLEENGFDPGDAMGTEGLKVFLYRKIAGGSATPEQVAAAAAFFGVDLPSDPGGVVRQSRPDPTLEDHPSRDLPEMPTAAALLPAAEAMVYRAMERAGARIRQDNGRPTLPGVAAWDVHTKLAANGSSAKVMEGAWTCAPAVLGGIEGIDVGATVAKLNAYCMHLLTQQQPHSREALAKFLEV